MGGRCVAATSLRCCGGTPGDQDVRGTNELSELSKIESILGARMSQNLSRDRRLTWSTLQQINNGVSQVWDTLVEGWQQLYRRAANAITRFSSGEAGEEEQQELALRSAGWGMLPAEVFDDDDKVVVRIEAPGMDGADFDIQVVENYLVVSGQKKVEREKTEGRYHVLERAYGHFERAIPLPEEVVDDEATAKYRRGVLEVVLPKSSASRRRKIEVKVN